MIEMNPTPPVYDVFFSYHSEDRDSVTRLADACQARGLKVFLDRWYLTPGQDWQRALANALSHCRAVAICLGPHGMGTWQQREIGLALNRQANESYFPVIPVLLPGSDHMLPDFLSLNTWVDLRDGIDDVRQLDILINAIQHQPPGPDQVETVLQTVNPYRNLRYFREEDAPFFFGRDAFIDKLADAVQNHSFVGVVGASGSGKSSLVRAGLIPRLRQGLGGHVWEVVTLVPGDRPLRALAVALAPLLEPETPPGIRNLENIGILKDFLERGENELRDLVEEALQKQPGTDRLMLIVDQWEELYTLTADDEARDHFIDQLLEATTKARFSVVFTLRGDFYGHAINHRSLADRLHNHVVNLGPMTREELEDAIAKPAHAVRLSFEPGLMETILNDVGNEPGSLPLLEFAVTALWDAGKDGRLLHDAYLAMGRVQGAVANRAETIYNNLTSLEQEAVKRVFLRLVRLGETTEDTRRRAHFTEIGEASRELIGQLADARLLVTGRDEISGEETIEVAHEALIQNWSRLQGWLDEDREFLLWRQRLRGSMTIWQENAYKPGFFLLGAPLSEAERWFIERPDELDENERAFIHKSIRRARWRRNLTLMTSIVVAVVMTVLAGIAQVQTWRAEREERLARARLLVAQGQAEYEEKPLLGLRLALEGLAMLPPGDEKTKEFTVNVIRRLVKSGRLLKIGDGIHHAYAMNNNTHFILEHTNKQGEIYRFSDNERTVLLPRNIRGFHRGVIFNPDRSFFVVNYGDVQSEMRDSINGDLKIFLAGKVSNFHFSPDEGVFVVDYEHDQDELRRSDNGEVIAPLADEVHTTRFSPRQNVFVVGYQHAQGELRHSDNGEVIALLADEISYEGVHFSPGQDVFVVDYRYAQGELRRSADGQVIEPLAGEIRAVQFSPDQDVFAVSYRYDRGELRNSVDGKVITHLADKISHDGVYFSSRHNLFAVDYEQAQDELRRSNNGRVLKTLGGEIGYEHYYIWGLDGVSYGSYQLNRHQDVFVMQYQNTRSELRNSVNGELIKLLAGNVSDVHFSPDQSMFVVDYGDTRGELRFSTDGQHLATLTGKLEGGEVLFNSDSSLFVVQYIDNRRELWETSVRPRRLAELGLSVDGAIFDKNHRKVLVWHSDGRGYMLDIDWLKAMGGEPKSLSGEELMRLACQGPFASDLFQESELADYLEGQRPKACQDVFEKSK